MPQHEFLLKLCRSNVAVLASVRGTDNLFVFPQPDHLWILGQTSENAIPAAFAALPGAHFRRGNDDRLIPVGHYLATEQLSAPDWIPLRQWLDFELPPAGWPGAIDTQIPLKLEPSDSVMKTSGVLTSIDALSAFVDAAAEFRFQHLTFAMDAVQRVFVVGSPVPAVRGTRFQIRSQIAIPAGFRWAPEVDAATVRQVFGDPEGTVLWSGDDQWEVIPADAFTSVTRAAVNACRDSNAV